ncbi:hypothetical protein BGZ58_005198 [Dissophora ornata]|nr:hypothetical protein BGZ58_005198 [Dissophora ornata]
MDMFRKERRFTPMSNQILETYFTYGNMDEHKEVKVPSKRTTGIEIKLEIDIPFVVASFLSSYMFTTLLWYDKVYFEMAPKVIIAFLRYILVRRAVPEYEDDIRKAIEIADRAKTELSKCYEFNKLMPEDVNQTCSTLFVKEYDLHDMPENSLEIMEQVVGVNSAAKVQLKDERMIYARVLRVESPAVDVEAGAETEDATTTDASADVLANVPADGSSDDAVSDGDLSETYKPVVTLKVDLEEMAIVDGALVPVAGKEFSIRLISEAATLLQEEAMIWGKFYTLSNGVTFARPLNAFPSFYTEEDEDI